MITPKKDTYGPEADRSNLADYMELLALAQTPLRRAELADYLKESDWFVRSRELYQLPAESGEEPPEDEDEGGAGAAPSDIAAGDIFQILSARAEALGPLYPFTVGETLLETRLPPSNEHLPYLIFLAITIAHHHGVDIGDDAPERVFEECVAQAMSARGLRTVDTGAAGRGAGGFRQLVLDVGEAVGLIGAPDGGAYRVRANEEGVDTVSHFSWGDLRAGHWVFIGQATCGRSNEWGRKIQEPRPAQWGELLTCVVPPIGFLAVPHHIEDEQISYLCRTHSRMVLDRLRLCRHLGMPTARQIALLDAVRARDVFHPLT